MHDLSHLGARIIFEFGDSGIYITETVFWATIVTIVLIVLALWSTSKMQQVPKGKQVIVEKIVTTVYDMVQQTMGKEVGRKFAPYMGTIFLFILLSNTLGLFGFRPVTMDMNATFALSIATFFIVQVTGFRYMGFKGKVKHMASPVAFLFVLNVIDDLARPVSLGFRLFGNILGGVILMSLLYGALAAGTEALLSSSVPFLSVLALPVSLFFDLFVPVLQAFIFTMLSMVFISQEAVLISAHKEH